MMAFMGGGDEAEVALDHRISYLFCAHMVSEYFACPPF
jgi:hypothetical protein